MIIPDVMMITHVIYDTYYVCHYYTCNMHYAGEMDGVLVMEDLCPPVTLNSI